ESNRAPLPCLHAPSGDRPAPSGGGNQQGRRVLRLSRSRTARCSALSPGKWVSISSPRSSESAGQYPRELVEAPVPSLVLGVAALVGRDAAVDHQHRGRAVGLREDVLGRSREGPLDTHHVAGLLGHRRCFRSSRYSPTTSKRRSQRSRWLSIQSEASASASGRRARRWVLPWIARLTTPASSSSFRCREMVGLETPKSRVTSPTVATPPLSRSTMPRRSGCDKALNASLAIMLTIEVSPANPRQEARDDGAQDRHAGGVAGGAGRTGAGGEAAQPAGGRASTEE